VADREGAAERWLATVRVWGLLTIAVQSSWFNALVRHGADARTALAEVRGVSAEDIRVRDCPE
jgi:hypothetical protein